MYRIALCEDSETDREWIKYCLRKLHEETDIHLQLEIFPGADEFIPQIGQQRFDIVILDVNLGTESGIHIAGMIRKTDTQVIIIFTTVNSREVFSSFAAEPLQYLLKPVNYQKLKQTLLKAFDKIDAQKLEKISFSFSGVTYHIPIRAVLYFESHKRLILVHTVDNEYRFYGTLSELARNPLLSSFVHCHISFLVNMEHIERFFSESITLDSGQQIAISRSRLAATKDILFDYLLRTKL